MVKIGAVFGTLCTVQQQRCVDSDAQRKRAAFYRILEDYTFVYQNRWSRPGWSRLHRVLNYPVRNNGCKQCTESIL